MIRLLLLTFSLTLLTPARGEEIVADRPDVWAFVQSLPNYVNGGLLVVHEEQQALDKAIEWGLQGYRDEAISLLQFIASERSGRREYTSLDLEFRGEDSFGNRPRDVTRQWIDAYLTFFPSEGNSLENAQNYDAILGERHRATKSVYRLYATSRKFRQLNFDRFHDTSIEKRHQLRRKIASQLWGDPASIDREQFAADIRTIRETLFEEHRSVFLVTDELLSVHSMSFPSFGASFPDHTTLLDIIRYRNISAKREQHRFAYKAFVFSCAKTEGFEQVYGPASTTPRDIRQRDWSLKLIDLGPAEPIDVAIRNWRASIATGDMATAPAGRVAQLVWQPLDEACGDAKHLFVVGDGDLANLPWAAIPTEEGRVLLERCSIARLPYATYLLQGMADGPADLMDERPPLPRKLLVVGGVANDLPFSKQVAETLTAMDPPPALRVLSGDQASVDAVLEQLPTTTHSHFAAHGAFAQNGLQHVRTLGLFPPDRQSSQVALLFSALLLAPSAPDDRIGVLTADMVSEVDMGRTQLAVLAACETGQGEDDRGEGVFGLTRAFHLAGCRDVISTLWRVDDRETARLMVRFYANLLDHQLPVYEALRQAQLFIYRHPDSAVSTTRSPLDFSQRRVALPGGSMQPTAKSPPKYWAGVYLSGAGEIDPPRSP